MDCRGNLENQLVASLGWEELLINQRNLDMVLLKCARRVEKEAMVRIQEMGLMLIKIY